MDLFSTNQIAPVAANAGLEQNISINTPTDYNIGNMGTPNNNGSPTNIPTGTQSPSVSGTPTWVTWAFFLAIGYFALRKLGGI